MAKKNDDFFIKKKEWSVVKDELLGCYLKPYVSKILHTYKPLLYVDCFAGKGKFEDGKDGSPLIALKIIDECCKTTKVEKVDVDAVFIDLNHAEDLKENLKDYPYSKVISGKYEEAIQSVLREKEGINLFLYIDPYGIKALNASFFDKLSRANYCSIELLINLNSFGFFREACNALGISLKSKDKTIFEDLYEYEPTKLDASEKSIEALNKIAGGEYWQGVIKRYKQKEIDGYVAESQIAEKYCARLMKSYNYVLNMPIRIKQGQRPKYRLIHATNHRDGCLLMVDNMCKRWQLLHELQSSGQMGLWEEDINNHTITDEDIKQKSIEFFSQYTDKVSLYDALANFFIKHGPICSTGEIKKVLKNLEGAKRIEIIRKPGVSKTGKPRRFMEENSRQTVSVRWIK